MRTDEFKLFEAEMQKLCAVLRGRFTAALVSGYWRALADVPFDEFASNAERIARTATKDTPFPRPAELRNKLPPTEHAPGVEEKINQAQALNALTWKELQRIDPEAYEIEHAIAVVGRVLAVDSPASVAYEQALMLDRQYRDRRMQLWQARAAARHA